jgi:hypothetical protein
VKDPAAGIKSVHPSHKLQPIKGTDFVTAPKWSRKSIASPILNVNELAGYSATAVCLCDTGRKTAGRKTRVLQGKVGASNCVWVDSKLFSKNANPRNFIARS